MRNIYLLQVKGSGQAPFGASTPVIRARSCGAAAALGCGELGGHL